MAMRSHLMKKRNNSPGTVIVRDACNAIAEKKTIIWLRTMESPMFMRGAERLTCEYRHDSNAWLWRDVKIHYLAIDLAESRGQQRPQTYDACVGTSLARRESHAASHSILRAANVSPEHCETTRRKIRLTLSIMQGLSSRCSGTPSHLSGLSAP
jgi:hypothetical protein